MTAVGHADASRWAAALLVVAAAAMTVGSLDTQGAGVDCLDFGQGRLCSWTFDPNVRAAQHIGLGVLSCTALVWLRRGDVAERFATPLRVLGWVHVGVYALAALFWLFGLVKIAQEGAFATLPLGGAVPLLAVVACVVVALAPLVERNAARARKVAP